MPAYTRGIAPTARQDRVMLGIGLILLAYLLFSGIDSGAKWLGLLGLPFAQLAFMRYAGHFVISTVIVLRSGKGWESFVTERLGLTLVRAGLLLISTVTNFVAIKYLPLTLTSTILFLSPIIICALSTPLLGERVGPFRAMAIFVGFGGILIAVRPFGAEFHWAVFLSLCGATCFALYQITTRVLTTSVATDTMQFYTGFVGTFVLAPFAWATWTNPATGFDWCVLVMLGVFGFAGHELLTRAYTFAQPYKLGPFAYSFMIYLMIWSYLVFDHSPDLWTLVGAAIVVCAGLFIGVRERQMAKGQL